MKKHIAELIALLVFCLLVVPIFFYMAATGGNFLATDHYVLGSFLLGISLAVLRIGVTITQQVHEFIEKKSFFNDSQKTMKEKSMVNLLTLEELDGWLTCDEAAERAGVSFQTVALWRLDGHIRAVKTRRGWLYDPASLDSYLKTLPENKELP